MPSMLLLLPVPTVAALVLALTTVCAVSADARDYLTIPLTSQRHIELPEHLSLDDITISTQHTNGVYSHKHHFHTTAVVSPTVSTPSTYAQGDLVGCVLNGFFAEWSIGTPAQKFNLLIDSGSSTLGVAGSSFQLTQSFETVTPQYNPLKSSSAIIDPYLLRLAPAVYGNGAHYSGQIIQDTVSVTGDNRGASIKFVDILESVAFFRPDGCGNGQTFQGIVGFAWQSLAYGDLVSTAESDIGLPTILGQGTDSYITQYFKQNPTVQPSFTHTICDLQGELYLGGAPTTSGPVYSTPSTSRSYWSIAVTSVGVDGSGVVANAADLGLSIVDSATSFWVLNNAAYTKITASLLNNTEFVKSFGSSFFSNNVCVNNPYASIAIANNKLPTITTTMTSNNGSTFNLQLNAIPSYLYAQYVKSSDNTYSYQLCPAIANAGSLTSGLSIFGITWLQNYQVTHTMQGKSSSVSFSPSSCPTIVNESAVNAAYFN